MKLQPHHHGQLQRLSALFLIIALPFLAFFLWTVKGASYPYLIGTIRHPALSAFLGVTIGVSLYHAVLGGQGIILDYLRGVTAKITLGLIYTMAILLMALTLYSLIGIITQ